VTDAGELDHGFWAESLLHEGRLAVGWHALLDPVKFDAHLERSARLQPGVVASAHGPVLRGPMVGEAFALVRSMAGLEPVAEPGQEALDFMVAAIANLPARAA
jgi:hypothetical protein